MPADTPELIRGFCLKCGWYAAPTQHVCPQRKPKIATICRKCGGQFQRVSQRNNMLKVQEPCRRRPRLYQVSRKAKASAENGKRGGRPKRSLDYPQP